MRPSLQCFLLYSSASLTLYAGGPAMAQSNEDLKAEINDLHSKLAEFDALKARLEKLEQLVTLSVVPVAEKTEKKTSVAVIKKAEPTPIISLEDGKYEFNIRGRVFVDAGWASDDLGSVDVDATEIRAGWFGIEGKAWDNVGFKLEADFGADAVSVKDAYIRYDGAVPVTIGQFKVPTSHEWLTSSARTPFMERSAFVSAFGMGRMMGIGTSLNGEGWQLSVGAFRGSVGSSANDEGLVLAARATYGQEFDGGLWMVGASARYRDGGDSTQRYRARPFSHLVGRLVDVSGTEKDTLFAFEGATNVGSLHLTSEWSFLSAEDAGISGDSASFNGGYIDIGYFLTGETRSFNLKKGVLGRQKINNPLPDGGWGAWEVLARYDRLDLTNDGLFGGQQTSYIAGVNWYINPYTRVMLNYARSDIEGKLTPDNSVDTFGTRVQVDW